MRIKTQIENYVILKKGVEKHGGKSKEKTP